jgi:hypothetical protein
MINVNRDNYLQGVTDVWRCRKCKTLYCDDKRYGEPLKASVGFDEIPPDEQWGILTCTTARDVAMKSLGVKPGKKLAHVCRGGEAVELTVTDDFSVSPARGIPVHRLYLVRDHINKNIEAGYYRLTITR